MASQSQRSAKRFPSWIVVEEEDEDLNPGESNWQRSTEEEEEEVWEDFGIEDDIGEAKVQTQQQQMTTSMLDSSLQEPVSIKANGKLQAALGDFEVFDCPICLDQLSTPVFQCENGHIACSSCCSKVKRKCPFCCMPIGINDSRCQGLEKLLESITISCKYARNCCAKMIPYSTKSEHEQMCPYVTCFCPYPSCTFSFASLAMYHHFGLEHGSSVTRFTYNTTFSLCVGIDQKQFFFQHELGSVVFILNQELQEHGRAFYVDSWGPSTLKNKFEYQLTAENMDASLSLKSVPGIYTDMSKHTPIKNYLTVPYEFADNSGLLSLSLCIKKITSSELEAEKIDLRVFDPYADKILLVVLTDPDVLDCSICLMQMWTPVFQCDKGHLVCSSCCSKQNSKCHCCGCRYNRCRGLEKVIESICMISCKYAKNGCKESKPYRRKSEHERECPHATCFCPHPSCTFAGSYKNLYIHFGVQHAPLITRTFTYKTTFSIYVDINEKHIFLQGENASVIFILNHQVEEHGRVFYVDCIGTSFLRNGVLYELTAKSVETSQSLRCRQPEIFTKWSKHSPKKNFLFVPSDLPGYNRPLSLSIKITLGIGASGWVHYDS